MTSQPRGFTFDNAYLALDEIFAGHPLKPAVFTAYLRNTMFSRIADSDNFRDIESDPGTQRGRFRDFHDQAQLFWATVDEIYQMDVINYKKIISDLWQTFKDLVDQVQQTRDGKDMKPQFYEAAHSAIIRDYRYFGDNETAKRLEERGTAQTMSEKDEELMSDVIGLVRDLDPKNDKSGYRLARRLCNNARPLFLKFLCDQIMGGAWWIKHQGGFDNVKFSLRVPSKYRLFCSPEEIAFTENMFKDNSTGAGDGGQQGSVIGNKFLHSDAGRVLLGAISKSLEGETAHDEEVDEFLLVAFYNDWDEWLSKYIADMIHHETPKPQQQPERRIIANYSTHFASTGSFKHDQKLSNRILQFMEIFSSHIQKWEDAGILHKEALKAIRDNQTGSGRSGNPNTSKVPSKESGDVVAVEQTDSGETPIGHSDETQLGGGWRQSQTLYDQGFGM